MNQKHFSIVVLVGVACFLSGCASIMSPRTQVVSIDSNPSGAMIKIDNKVIGTTPLTQEMVRKSGRVATIEKEGYKPFALNLNTGINSWIWGNILLFGPFGTTTDAVNGTLVEYSPNQYLINLQPTSSSAIEAPVIVTDAQKVKNFVASQNASIREDIAKGGGTYLSTLMTLLKIEKEDRDKEIARIKEIAEMHRDPMEFSEKLIGEHLGAQ